MNEMMEGCRAEVKNGMVQSEPVAVILRPHNSSSWTAVLAAAGLTAGNYAARRRAGRRSDGGAR